LTEKEIPTIRYTEDERGSLEVLLSKIEGIYLRKMHAKNLTGQLLNLRSMLDSKKMKYLSLSQYQNSYNRRLDGD
jgi:hypothetical protein